MPGMSASARRPQALPAAFGNSLRRDGDRRGIKLELLGVLLPRVCHCLSLPLKDTGYLCVHELGVGPLSLPLRLKRQPLEAAHRHAGRRGLSSGAWKC